MEKSTRAFIPNNVNDGGALFVALGDEVVEVLVLRRPQGFQSEVIDDTRPSRFVSVCRSAAAVEPAGVSAGACPRLGGVRSTLVSHSPRPPGPTPPRRTALLGRRPRPAIGSRAERTEGAPVEDRRETPRRRGAVLFCREHDMTASTKLIHAIANALIAEYGEEAIDWREDGGRANVERILAEWRISGSSGSRRCWSSGRVDTECTGWRRSRTYRTLGFARSTPSLCRGSP